MFRKIFGIVNIIFNIIYQVINSLEFIILPQGCKEKWRIYLRAIIHDIHVLIEYFALKNSKDLIRVRYFGSSSSGESDLTKIGRSTGFRRGTEAGGKRGEGKKERERDRIQWAEESENK